MPTTPPFTVSFQITLEDLVDYLRVTQRTLNNLGMGAGLVGAVYGIYLAYLGDAALGAVLLVMGVFLFLASATPYLDRVRARPIAKRIAGTQATFVMDEGGISSDTFAGKSHITWNAADRTAESPDVIVLRRGRNSVMWLPTRAMGSPDERDALLAFIRAHVGPQPS